MAHPAHDWQRLKDVFAGARGLPAERRAAYLVDACDGNATPRGAPAPPGRISGARAESTALVHEVYLRLVDVDRMTLKSRTHFFALATTLMRQILVDHAPPATRGQARRAGYRCGLGRRVARHPAGERGCARPRPGTQCAVATR